MVSYPLIHPSTSLLQPEENLKLLNYSISGDETSLFSEATENGFEKEKKTASVTETIKETKAPATATVFAPIQ